MRHELTFQFFFLGIFAVANNFKSLGQFLQISTGLNRQEQLKLSRIATLASLIIMLVALLLGEAVLQFIGISLDSFRIAGGLVLVILGIEMIHARNNSNDELVLSSSNDYSKVISTAIIPVAIPFTTGAGTFSTIIIFAVAARANWQHYAELVAAIMAQTVIIYLVFRYSRGLLNLMGRTGMSVLIRVVGLFTLSQGIEFILQGVKDAFPGISS